MARRSLIIISALPLLTALMSSCQTDAEKVAEAAAAKAVAEMKTPLPDLPSDCTAKMRRPPKPVIGEPPPWQEQRWRDSADARDRQAKNCDDFWNQYKAGAK